MYYERENENIFYPIYESSEESIDEPVEIETETETESESKMTAFTQDQVNTFLAKEKRRWQREKDSLVSQIEDLTKSTNLSDQDRASWDAKIKQIKDESENKIIEQSKMIKRLQGQIDSTVKAKDEEISKYKGLFINTSIRREITDAAVKHKAFNSRQIVDMLISRAEHRPVLDDDGKETGDYETWIRAVETKDEKSGEPVIIDMKAMDAVAVLNETDPNLFKPNLVGGLQLNPVKGSGDGVPDMKNYRQYKEWRSKHGLR